MRNGSVFLIIFYCNILYASHDFIMGTGAVSQGFGGAGVADGGEPSIIFTNPSGITSSERTTLSFGTVLGHQDLRINERSFDSGSYSIVEGGVIIPFSGRLSSLFFGLSLTFPQPSIMYLYSQQPTFPQFINYRNMLRYSIKPALAYRFYDRLSVGMGIDIFGASSGKAMIIIDLANQKTTQSDFIMDQKFTYTPVVGLQYDFSKIYSLGLSYRFENRFNIEIDTNFDMQLMNMRVLEEGESFFVPAEIMFGFKAIPQQDLKVLIDIGYLFFSDMPSQHVMIDIEPSVLLPSVSSSEQRQMFRISAKNIVRVRGGMAYSLLNNRIVLRGGYQYFPTPIPDQIYNTNILDSDRHIVALGSGFHLSDPTEILINGFDINIYFQYHHLVYRRFNKVDPLDPYGDYSINGGILEGGIGISFSL